MVDIVLFSSLPILWQEGMPLDSSFENTGFVIDYKFSATLWPDSENVIYTF